MAVRCDWEDEVDALRADIARTSEDVATTREEIAQIMRSINELNKMWDDMRRSQASSIFGELAAQALCALCSRAGIRLRDAHSSTIDVIHEGLCTVAARNGLSLQALVDLRAKARAVAGASSPGGFFWDDVERRITTEWESERALIEQLVRLRLRCPHMDEDYGDSDGEGDAGDEGVALEAVVW